MPIRHLIAASLLACAPALHAQELALQPDVLVASVDTMYTVVTGGGEADTIAVAVQTMRRVAVDGREVWEVEYAYSERDRGEMVDTTTFDVATLLPVEQRRLAAEYRVDAEYRGRDVKIRVLRPGVDAPQEWTHTFEQPVFAGSVMDVVFRALPLDDGYRARIPFLVIGADGIAWLDVRVTGLQAVETRDGPVAAWRVEASAEGNPPDVLWIARDSRMLLRLEYGGGGAVGIR